MVHYNRKYNNRGNEQTKYPRPSTREINGREEENIYQRNEKSFQYVKKDITLKETFFQPPFFIDMVGVNVENCWYEYIFLHLYTVQLLGTGGSS